MSVQEKYKTIFGEINSLADQVSWTTGVSNMHEWLAWDTRCILGISKTAYRKRVVVLAHDEANKGKTVDQTLNATIQSDQEEMKKAECTNRYDKPKSSLASAREVMRRTKYFSEDYLNKEFDIFWTLVSDRYLDQYYGQFTKVQGGAQWFTHGNSGIFSYSLGINDMQMDNLSYNPEEKLLVANELKLGGSKNKDQMLKYGLLLRTLKERHFVLPDTRLLLLFIGSKEEHSDWDELLRQEIAHCRESLKSTARKAVEESNVKLVKQFEFAQTTWQSLMRFNEEYASELSETTQQVERKLLSGFNETLSKKGPLQHYESPNLV